MSRVFLLTVFFLLQSLVIATLPAHAAGKRVALIIGNAAYTDVGILANPIADAKAVTTAFESAGFDNVRHVDNLSADAMRQELKDFSARAADADIAVVYYAGHGVEVADQNYLVPVDAKLLRSTDIEFEAIPLSTVRSAVSGAAKLRIVVLDACRNNPFKLSAANGGKRAASRGLGNIEPSAGEVVAYSAKEGTLAQDGPSNENSPYAAALVKSLNEPGLEIRLLFGKVRDEVLTSTKNEQEPYTYASLGGEAIYLKPPVAVVQPSLSAQPLTFRDCAKCPEMIVIPAGDFVMGSPDDETDRDADEGPQHEVSISKPFAVGRYEITVAQFRDFVTSTGHDIGTSCSEWDGKGFVIKSGGNFQNPGTEQGSDHPATCVSWRDAKAYVEWLSQRTHFNYRLLTEAEWEYAARAGSTSPYSTGENLDAKNVNMNGKGSQPVGQLTPNKFGLYDMQGNVWEWTEDCYAKTYSKAPADGSAFVSPGCERTYRGGAWANVAKDMRFATRGVNADDKRVNIFGLRVARDSK